MNSGITKSLMSHISEFLAVHFHIQKDKRTEIGSHMEKCVFIGFYNPTTKRTVISNTPH
jgi:hypothetical protein